jgi:NgoMIV restriction enzyme
MSDPVFFLEARRSFHAALLKGILRRGAGGVFSNADKHSPTSVKIALGVADKLGPQASGARLAGQMAGNRFEVICAEFVEQTFGALHHLRPGSWNVRRVGGRNRLEIARYEQYAHLVALHNASQKDPELAAALGSDYTITPDIIICRDPEEDEVINEKQPVVDETVAGLTALRKRNNILPILHASISCKWTIRSDRAQNARSEGLNLVRNRKGRLPHIAVVTGEPSPSRIASIALGTGDIDCVYHFALPELEQTVDELGLDDARDLVQTMTSGKRLRDIADLPLDLAI